MNVVKDGVPEGLFINNVAFGIIALSQTYFFLPVWIIVMIGGELSSGHVNRVAFAKSRRFYFLSKIFFCGLVTLFFSILGLLSLVIAVKTSPFEQLDLSWIFTLEFLVQLMFATFAYSILLLCLVLLFRSPIITFVAYFAMNFLEAIAFQAFKGIYNTELSWLPLHLIRTLYCLDGEVVLISYYNPFTEDASSLIVPFGFVLVLILISWLRFSKSDLKPLSD